MQWLRSALYNFLMVLSVGIYAPLSLFTFILPYRQRFIFISFWGAVQVALLKHLCKLDYRIEGRENIPATPVVVMAKHQSTWETYALQGWFRPQVWVLKRELLWIPLFGWALAMLKPVAIDRGSGRRAMEQLVQQGQQRLESGCSVVIFPEGTRVASGQRGRYKIGGAVLATATGYPVVPVAHNAGDFWPRHSFVKYPGTVRVIIGAPIAVQDKTAEQLRQEIEDWIEDKMSEIARSTPSPND